MGRHPTTQTTFFGILQFKHPHPGYPKKPLLAKRVLWYGCLGRYPTTQAIPFDILRFKHPHPRSSKTPLRAYKVQRDECLGRHPRTQYFSAFCNSNTPILGLQKHFCCPMGYGGMGAQGATPEPKQYFLGLCTSNTTIIGIQKLFCWPMGYRGMGVRDASPEQIIFWHCAVQTTLPYHKSPKTPLLAYGVWRYGCLGHHPRTQTILFCIVHFKHHQHEFPKTALLGNRVQR